MRAFNLTVRRTLGISLALSTLLASCQLSPSVSTARPQAAVQVFLWGNPDTTDRDLKLAKDGGFAWVKQLFEWRNIEKAGKGQFEWTEPDRVVGAVDGAGLKLVARVDESPAWSRSVQVYPDDGPPDHLSDWTDYLTAFASRYKGRIAAYEIWNEPNLMREWGDEPPDASAYVTMLKASYAAIKAVDPSALVITAGLSPTTDISEQATADTVYLQDMYAEGAKGSFDLLGANAAGFRSPPEADPAAVANDPVATNHDPSSATLRRVYAFRHVEDLRQIMVDAGDERKGIAILETGWTSDTRPGSSYAWFGVSEDTKGDYLARAFAYTRENWPWAAFMTVIYIPDPRWADNQEEVYWSITQRNGAPLPAYNDLKQTLTSKR